MPTVSIDFNKVIQYSLKNCVQKSIAKCALYVKRAFEAGGCKYVSGNGWSNQTFCKTNGFELIGDFIPEDNNPRAHNGKPIQFPKGYVQQVGDICLIQHGTYGHICYAAGPNINDWISDYFQRPPGQADGTGPYCYSSGYQRVQFWRHSSVRGNAPVVDEIMPSGTLAAEWTSTETQKMFRKSSTPVVPMRLDTMGDVNFDNYNMVLGTNIRQK